MKIIFSALAFVLFIFQIMSALAEQPKDFAARLSRQIIPKGGGQLEYRLKWDNTPNTIAVVIYKKNMISAVWEQIGQIDSAGIKNNINSWLIDNEPMEYMVQRIFRPSSPTMTIPTNIQYDTVRQMIATGYITAGFDNTAPDNKGALLLIVDSLVETRLASKIDRLEQDLKNEWWDVKRIRAPRTEQFSGEAVKKVKDAIKQIYSSEKNKIKAAFIIGHVAVPYSGLTRPDGHPDHLGAWAADAYYGDIDGNWTDITVNDAVSASRPANKNIPGDGKFDQSVIPSNLEIAIGRVDFYDMPAFRDSVKHKSLFDSEVALLERYFDKNHAFRSGGSLAIARRALIDDNFGSYTPEMFASSGWRLASVCEPDSVRAGKASDELKNNSYMWFYGCGGGSYTSCGGVGTTNDFAKQPINAVFTSLFGSYFGDWDNTNNIMRAMIAAEGLSLTCSWSARPQWYFHRMGMGATIGDAFLTSINNDENNPAYYPNVYYTQSFPGGVIYQVGSRGVHMALIGDPTLRMTMGGIPEPPAISISQPGTYAQINWAPATDSLVGYIIHRADSTGNRVLLTAAPLIKINSFRDSNIARGNYRYEMRSVKLRYSPSASYYDANGNPASSDFAVTGVAEQTIATPNTGVFCSPNPVSSSAHLLFALPCASNAALSIRDMAGVEVARWNMEGAATGLHEYEWNLVEANGARVAPGAYLAVLTACGGATARTIIVVPE